MKRILIGLLALGSFSSFASMQSKPLAVQCEMALTYKIIGRTITLLPHPEYASLALISTLGSTDHPQKIGETPSRLYSPEAQVDFTELGARNQLQEACTGYFQGTLSSQFSDENIEEMQVRRSDLSLLIARDKSQFLMEMVILGNQALPTQIWQTSERSNLIKQFCRKAAQNKTITMCEVQPQGMDSNL